MHLRLRDQGERDAVMNSINTHLPKIFHNDVGALQFHPLVFSLAENPLTENRTVQRWRGVVVRSLKRRYFVRALSVDKIISRLKGNSLSLKSPVFDDQYSFVTVV